MTRRRRRNWNLLALASIVMAVILSVTALTKLNVDSVRGRDALRLSSASRALTTEAGRLPPDGWSSLRGPALTGPELEADIDALESAPYCLLYTSDAADE